MLQITPENLSIHNYSPTFGAIRGNGFIAGETPNGLLTKAGVPAREKIFLGLQDSKNLGFAVVAVQYSNADGTYRFEQLDESRKYVVLAHDSEGNFNSVIRANITPVPMP